MRRQSGCQVEDMGCHGICYNCLRKMQEANKVFIYTGPILDSCGACRISLPIGFSVKKLRLQFYLLKFLDLLHRLNHIVD